MKNKLGLLSILLVICLSGCSNSKVTNLENEIQNLKLENEQLKSNKETLQNELDYIKNGANNIIVQIRNYHEQKDNDNLLKLADELHTNFNGTDEDIEAQEYVSEITRIKEEEKRKQEEEAQRKREEEAKTREEILKNIIRVSRVDAINMDYLGGVDLIINFTNNSDKIIKYIIFNCQPINAVGDAVECTITMSSEKNAKATGPYNKGEGLSGTNFYWSKAWYNSSIKSVRLNSIEIEYMDGSKERIVSSDVDLVRY